MNDKLVRVAAVQAEPVWFDVHATIDKTIDSIGQAASQGAQLVAFPETWLPGYPHFLWLGPVAQQAEMVMRYHNASVELNGPELLRIERAAAEHGIHVVLGFSEKSGGSLYMAQAMWGPNGRVLARRKVRPTHVERTLFGDSDGSSLQVVDTPLGRVGALNCWEHLQPLFKMAMFSQDEQIHVSGWPCFGLYRGLAYALGEEANMAITQVYALEGSTFVVASTQTISQEGIALFATTDEQRALLQPGGGAARIYGPDGSLLSDNLADDVEGVVYADLDLDLIHLAKNAADPVGHYGRPDVVQLKFDRAARSVVVHEHLTTPGEHSLDDPDLLA